jgi:hypothetical protein
MLTECFQDRQRVDCAAELLALMWRLLEINERFLQYCSAHGMLSENILSVSCSIGHLQRIFSQSRVLLVTYREYSLSLVFYWSPTENIPSASSSIGHLQRIFLQPRVLLVTHREYSLILVFYWSPTENIPSASCSIGHLQRIFSQSRLLLVTYREYSFSLVFYWSPTENILSVSCSIGHPEKEILMGDLLVTALGSWGDGSPVAIACRTVQPNPGSIGFKNDSCP